MKGKSTVSAVKNPNALIYFCVVPLVKLYFSLFFRHSTDRSSIKDISPPYLVIAGHGSWLDYLITTVSMFPVRMNFVGAYNFFRDRLLKTVFTLMGVIPRYQFTSDTGSVRKMKYCVDKKRVVALFPHGCLSNEGRPGGFAGTGVAKLVKFLNVPVVALKTDGGYLTRPRWSKKPRFGRIYTKAVPVLSLDDIKNLTEKEIYGRIIKAIDFDDYKWQRERMIPFRCKKPAEGVEHVLYKCPKCQSEFSLRTKGNRLYCLRCGNVVRMNRFLFFEPETPDTVFFDGIDRWYDFQRQSLEKEIEDPAFELCAKTELKYAEPGKFGYQHQGYGELRLIRDAIIYEGIIQKESSRLVLPMKHIPMIPFAADEYIEVASGNEIHRFVLEDRRQMMKWVLSVRLIRDKFYER
ncbi:MAG: 2-acyl-glycerophospho-ethanolamine acyltransferase [Firmicutes bacterium ADurb.Bin182]|nr:MAG: 2-acyl-glycerophospho-ethanolamine acyltransferase [Firmicutes bacterium ADurb.Bin182]